MTVVRYLRTIIQPKSKQRVGTVKTDDVCSRGGGGGEGGGGLLTVIGIHVCGTDQSILFKLGIPGHGVLLFHILVYSRKRFPF